MKDIKPIILFAGLGVLCLVIGFTPDAANLFL